MTHDIQPLKTDWDKFDLHVKPGDTLSIDIEEVDGKLMGEMANETEEQLEELFDIDIPPPPDLKAEYFLALIEMEYEKIEQRAKNILKTALEETQVSLYANKNIQRLKEIAGQAHILSKKLPHEGRDSLDDPDGYIIYVLKTYLIRTIVFYQRLL